MHLENLMTASFVKKISFVSVYVDDFSSALSFYQKHFGFEKKHDMGATAVWGKIGDVGLYIEGGNKPVQIAHTSVRASFVLNVDSAASLFQRLKDDNVSIIQTEPQDMGSGTFWFQFFDPAGNLLEVLGGAEV